MLDPGEIVLGENEHVNPAADEHESVICPLKPPTAAECTVIAELPPGATVTLGADTLSEKFVPAADAGTSVANNPLV